jgi:hypothetical protein
VNKAQRWEIIGIFLIIGFGSTLHFWFEWTDFWRPMALIAAVNESTWEHFKMAFWPGLFFALIEYPFLRDETNNFIVAKFTGLLAIPIITAILFYGYTSLTGTHLLWADVIIFIVSVIGGQWISLIILTRTGVWRPSVEKLALVGLILMIFAFSTLTYFPRKHFLFEDPRTGEYGILSDYNDHDH